MNRESNSEIESLRKRLEELFFHGEWIAGTQYKELLSQVDFSQAQAIVGGRNTIAMLTYHINYYLAGLLEVLEGKDLSIRDADSYALPEMNNPSDWESLKEGLLKSASGFIQALGRLDDSQLNSDFVRPEYGTWKRNIEGLIEHSYYHLGQMVMLYKILSSGEEKNH